jgi:hypothetical protein
MKTKLNKEITDYVVNFLYKDKSFDKLYNKLNAKPFHKEDLRQYIAEYFLTIKKTDKINELFNENKLGNYISGIMYHSLKYKSSPFYKTFIKEQHQYDYDIENLDLIQYADSDDLDIRKQKLYNALQKTKFNWIELMIFKDYFFDKQITYKKLADEYNVTKGYIYLQITEIKKKIKENL